jgi:hypothetical protein
VFLEHPLALELRSLGFLEKIFPVMVGNADDPSVTPSPSYTNCFSSGCNPKAADVHVESVKMKQATQRRTLGTRLLFGFDRYKNVCVITVEGGDQSSAETVAEHQSA